MVWHRCQQRRSRRRGPGRHVVIAWWARPSGAGQAGGVIGLLAVIAAAPARPNRDGPPLGFSGGFGESDCTSCHFEAEVNSAAGRLVLSGVPVAYEPGETYRVQLRLTHPGVVIGGFEMTARFEGGGAPGGAAVLPTRGPRPHRGGNELPNPVCPPSQAGHDRGCTGYGPVDGALDGTPRTGGGGVDARGWQRR